MNVILITPPPPSSLHSGTTGLVWSGALRIKSAAKQEKEATQNAGYISKPLGHVFPSFVHSRILMRRRDTNRKTALDKWASCEPEKAINYQ